MRNILTNGDETFAVIDGFDRHGAKYVLCAANCDHDVPVNAPVWHDAAHTETFWEVVGTDRKSPVIVSRHAGAIAFIRSSDLRFADAEVVAQATWADVAGRLVAGNLPLHLAAAAAAIVAVEFAGTPPRGAEYGVAEMEAAGARLRTYRVAAL